jgi:hypothetical protein
MFHRRVAGIKLAIPCGFRNDARMTTTRHFFRTLTVATGALAFAARLGAADVPARAVEYQGWKGALELNNGIVRVVVAPEVGRIVHYGFVNGANVLWLDPNHAGQMNTNNGPALLDGRPAWIAYGGDRIWPTEEDRFEEVNGARRPPDYFFDGMPWEARIEKNTIVMTSPVSRFCGAQVTRRISLAPDSAQVTIQQTLAKVQPGRRKEIEPIPLTLWNISTVRLPEQIFFPLNPRSRFTNQVYVPVWPDVPNRGAENFHRENGLGAFLPNRVDQKVGADAPGWIAAIQDNAVFVEFSKFDSKADYPDGGTSVAAYLNPNIGEMECLSPLARLKPGETLNHTVWWDLGTVHSGTLEQRRVEAVRWIETKNPAR